MPISSSSPQVLSKLAAQLRQQGFKTNDHPYSLNALAPVSELRIQFSTDERYQAFLPRSVETGILGIRVRIACLEDVARGKLWACSDPRRRLSRRKKDELDLIRLADAHPDLRPLYPIELQEQLDRG